MAIRSPLRKSGPGKLWSSEEEREAAKKRKRRMERGEKWTIMAASAIKEVMEPTESPGVFWGKYEACGFPQNPTCPPEAGRDAMAIKSETNFIEQRRGE